MPGPPMFKEPRVSTKVRRGLKRRARDTRLDAAKRTVRARDKHMCRFPQCGCRRFNILLHVSHSKHQGMGGNPAEDRNDPALLVLVCAARHREHSVSIDKGTLRWEPLTAAGANGPIRWLIHETEILLTTERGVPHESEDEGWVEIARELFVGQAVPTGAVGVSMLAELGRMLR